MNFTCLATHNIFTPFVPKAAPILWVCCCCFGPKWRKQCRRTEKAVFNTRLGEFATILKITQIPSNLDEFIFVRWFGFSICWEAKQNQPQVYPLSINIWRLRSLGGICANNVLLSEGQWFRNSAPFHCLLGKIVVFNGFSCIFFPDWRF